MEKNQKIPNCGECPHVYAISDSLGKCYGYPNTGFGLDLVDLNATPAENAGTYDLFDIRDLIENGDFLCWETPTT